MLKNYFKTAWRGLIRNKMSSLINLLGLTIGLASVIFILIWIQNELSYDAYNKNADRTYRVSREFLNSDGSTNLHLAAVALPFQPLLKESFPEIETTTRFLQDNDVMRIGENKFTENKIIWSDDHFFDVFTNTFIEGDARTALKEPNSIVITKEMAKKYFVNKDALNQTLYYSDKQIPLKVTGVVAGMPTNAHFNFDFAISFVTLEQFLPKEDFLNDWGGNNYFTYVVLKKNANAQKLEAKFPAFLDKIMPFEENAGKGSKWNKLHLQKLTDIHLHSHLMGEAAVNSDIKYVYIFGCIAFFILLIACINYMNLASALALTRLKEVGVRKVIGARRSQLFAQFFTESSLIIVIALVLSITTVILLMPAFENFNETAYTFSIQQYVLFGIGIMVLLFGTVLLAGSYPSVYISSFRPVAILKGTFTKGDTRISLRKVLVVFQFTISISLIVAVLIISKQLNYMQNADLGFDKNWLITLPVNDSIRNNFETVKDILRRNSNIKNATFSSRIPSGQLLDEQGCKLEMNGSLQSISFRLSNINTDFDYMKTFGMQIAAGRDFSKDLPTDSINSFIVNEATVRAAGWQTDKDAINKQIEYGGRKGRIVGVVKDFNFESLDKPIMPIVFYITPDGRRVFSIRLTGNNLQSTIQYVKNTWQQFAPNMDFSYTFLDDKLHNLYKAEQKLNTIYILFAAIAIFIACLGLFGLATFTAQQRTKEIGIRKVLGASTMTITSLISKDFIKLVVLALIIATPIAWWAMSQWLQNFAFHISINAGTFLSAGLLAIIIAIVTISFQAVKAAFANPVKSLRSE